MALDKAKTVKQLVKELEKNYLLERACKRLGVTRSTVYRWMQEDVELATRIRAAQSVGRRTMSDYVESKLLKNIEGGNQRSIEFWLKSNNERYRANDKTHDRQIQKLEEKIRESEAALAAVGKNFYSEFMDLRKLRDYMRLELENTERSSAEYRNLTEYDLKVVEQARKMLKRMMIADYITHIGGLPEEDDDLAD